MIEVWRICARKHARTAYSGQGARLFGGRWNPPGVPVVYTAESLSLCALELFVHLEPENLPPHLVAISAALPDDLSIESISPKDLPRSWREYPAPDALQTLGAEWAEGQTTAVLAVPSAVIPHEQNYLINPAHPAFKKIRVRRPQPFQFDPRMWK